MEHSVGSPQGQNSDTHNGVDTPPLWGVWESLWFFTLKDAVSLPILASTQEEKRDAKQATEPPWDSPVEADSVHPQTWISLGCPSTQ